MEREVMPANHYIFALEGAPDDIDELVEKFRENSFITGQDEVTHTNMKEIRFVDLMIDGPGKEEIFDELDKDTCRESWLPEITDLLEKVIGMEKFDSEKLTTESRGGKGIRLEPLLKLERD